MKAILAVTILLGISQTARAAMCESEAKSIVAATAKINFNTPAGYAPVIRSAIQNVTSPETGNVEFVIDMQNAQGQILNGDRDGSSAFDVKLAFSAFPGRAVDCFINSVDFVDEPLSRSSIK